MLLVERILGNAGFLGLFVVIRSPGLLPQEPQSYLTWQGSVLAPDGSVMPRAEVVVQYGRQHLLRTFADERGQFRIAWDRRWEWNGRVFSLDRGSGFISPAVLLGPDDSADIIIQMIRGENLLVEVIDSTTGTEVPNLAILFDQGSWMSVGTTGIDGRAEVRCASEILDRTDAQLSQLFDLGLITIDPIAGQGYGFGGLMKDLETLPDGKKVLKLEVFLYPERFEATFIDSRTGDPVLADVYRIVEGLYAQLPFSASLLRIVASGSAVSLPGIPSEAEERLSYCALAPGYRPATFAVLGRVKEPVTLPLDPCDHPSIIVECDGSQVAANVFWVASSDYSVWDEQGRRSGELGFPVAGRATSATTGVTILPTDNRDPIISLSVDGLQGKTRNFGRLRRERLGASPWKLNLTPATRAIVVRTRNASGEPAHDMTLGVRFLTEGSEDLGVRARDDGDYSLPFRRGFDVIGTPDGNGEWLITIPVAQAFLCAVWPAGQWGSCETIRGLPATVQLAGLQLDFSPE